MTENISLPMSGQLPLPLPAKPPRYDRRSFLLAPSNETAWRAGQAWLKAGEASLIICGPAGSGKTHLASILAGGPDHFVDWWSATSATAPFDIVVFDDMPANEPKTFLLAYEAMLSAGKRVILAGRGHPGQWAMGLKDLRTRLEAIARASLDQPDEALLRAVMTKSFSDRQLRVAPQVIEYVAPRLPRTFEAALAFSSAADKTAIREKKKITIAMAKQILDDEPICAAERPRSEGSD